MVSKRNYLTKWDLARLKKLYKSEKNEKVKTRLLCAIHRKQGKSILEIADLVCIPKSTVHDYLQRFENTKNVSAIADKNRPGKPSKLTSKEIKQLVCAVEQSPKKSGLETDEWSTRLIKQHILNTFDKKYTMFGVRKLLKKLGFSLQKPRPIHHLGSLKEQSKFKKNLDGRSRFLNEKTTKYFIWMKPRS